MSLTKVSYSMIVGAPINIMDFGASPINSSAANATAIQAALTYAATLGSVNGHDFRAVVYVPDGLIFPYNATLNVSSYTGIVGFGTLQFTGTGYAVSLGSDNSRMLFRDFTLTTTSAAATVGIYGLNAIGITFENIRIVGDLDSPFGFARWTTAGVQLDTAAPSNSFIINFTNCQFTRCAGDCIKLTGNAGTADVNITGCSMSACDSWGIRSTGATNPAGNLNITGNEIEGFGSVGDYGMVFVGFGLGVVISNNHFEHSVGATLPLVVIGTEVSCAGLLFSNNGIGGAGTGVTPYLLNMGNVSQSNIVNNVSAQAAAFINVATALFQSTVENNNQTAPTTLFSAGSSGRIVSTRIQTAGIEYFQGGASYTSPIRKNNSSVAGTMPAAPGVSPNTLAAIAGGIGSVFDIGDSVFNSVPVVGGYAGWICTVAGVAHVPVTGTLAIGSNVITAVSGGIYDWTVGDLICTQTDALGVSAGTTVINKGATTLEISTNATANGAVALFGARFNGFGEIVL